MNFAEHDQTGAVELGRAIVTLVSGELPDAPTGTAWLYGLPGGRDAIEYKAN